IPCLMRLHQLALRAYIAPFACPKRAMLYGGTSIGVLGFDLALLVASYHLAGMGLLALGGFWAVFFALSGFVMMPGLCQIYSQLGRTKAIGAFFAMLIGGALILSANLSPVWLAIAFGLVSMPFWTAYHLSLLLRSSDANRSHEVSIAYVMIAIGGCLG